ncbi:tRNA methyltransferase complex GCD14 subunit [Neorickettsia helminthoeca str. Oregon]|uniref:tRNA methyltransferase complex GCD14 subunit n=1 Tax=Neorickettsia helminthoeca str. Oregon TaxID=1286528 RepID=X5HKF4_9RICK|nr:O-methyltransferase [Neorickettsia helminthoeca]AHX11514.1 tRNA methyltransferase complex GCD14 subunit [Neorickettsia helminthoeca str. Oregon]
MHLEDSEVIKYIISKLSGECGLLRKIREETFSDKRKFMQIGRIEGKILELLIKMNSVKTIVEVGTLAGYSTIWMAKTVGPEGRVYTIEKNPEHAQIASQNFRDFTQIKLIVGDAKTKLDELIDFSPFDMMFIDAEKSGYPEYLCWAEKNIKSGGLIVADNTLSFGESSFANKGRLWDSIDQFNSELSNPDKYDSVIIQTENGMTIALKK